MEFVSTLISAFPIVLLIWLMTKKAALPSHIALPIIALLVGIIQLFYFQTNIRLLLANTIAGALSVLTPISIIAGAILLNRILAFSGAEKVITAWLNSISTNAVAQLMIIGWAFAFMLEGASGFGTPAAIAAPMLVGLGFKPLKVAVLALIMNSVPVSFGAVGTPIWFGLEALNLSSEQLLSVSSQTALINLVAGLVIPIIALRFVVSWQLIRGNITFIFLSILACTLPYYLLANWNYEFPSLLGGAIGLMLSIVLAKADIGLKSVDNDLPKGEKVPFKPLFIALFPLILLIVILIVTRIEQLGIKGLLNNNSLWFGFDIADTYFSVSQALVLSVEHILQTSVNWSYKALYVPALIPFLLVVLISIPLLKMSAGTVKEAFVDTGQRIKLPLLSLIGALIMVNFMMLGDEQSPIFLIANAFANVTGDNWSYFAAFLGALGSFFSGSSTVSNLTFGGIQLSIAEQVGLPITLVLALQSAGAAMGNMVCINNIIAVSSILGIVNQEGNIIKKTILPMIIYGVITALVGAILLFSMQT
ncbi:L-lactate permease [Pseudoalteromonas sp. SWXJZ94C]|uniref:L-lactate permease n=1 Tax=Pseudoalteromonas sp. SWXJZ94C TaxID=2792065 RepID=UPI0018CCD5F0|nr:L-lactate permease [Pseudoalteromonas sp. SWXJZ94C]MBH0055688.1 L-lactate permease [Pseudoalteromonas sp. SWXJZ94C]